MKKQNVKPEKVAKLRQKAEKQMKLRKDKACLVSADSTSEPDLLKLIHELEVNQIELEMQNEELIAAKQRIEELANEKYKELYDFAPSGYLSISKEGDILELNFAAARMLGKERSKLINNRFALFISQETRADFNLFIQNVFTTRSKQNCEVVIATKGNNALAGPIDVKIDGLILQNNEFCLLTLIDITEFKKSEDNLLKINTIFGEAEKISNIGSFEYIIHENEFTISEGWQRIHGVNKKVLKMDELMPIAHPDDRVKIEMAFDRALNNIAPYDLEHAIVRQTDNETRIIKTRGKVIYDRNDKPFKMYGFVEDITERKQAEEKLKTSDKIFNHSLDLLCIAGFDGYFKVLNPAWTKTLGWSNEEILSKPWIDFVHPNDRDNTKDIKTVIIDGKEVYQFENRYICKDGTIKWLSWNSFSYPEEYIMFGVARDVTVSKQREMIINNFFEQPLNINLIADFEGNINRVNSAWDIYLGYPKDEIIGRNFFDFIHPDDISITVEEMKKIEKGITTFHFENRYRHKNGEYRKLAWSSITSLDEHLVYAVAFDITEKQQAEEALRKSEAIKNAMVSNIGDVIVIIDQNGITQYKSPNVTKLFGWKPEELIGNSIWDNVNPDHLEEAQKFIATIAIEPNAAGTTEMQYKRKDGEYVWIEISVINLLHNKDIQGILGNYSDISERKQAEQIQQQLDITRKTMMFKQNFLANMSHEIRTPLTGVLGMIEILEQTQLDIKQKDYINTLKTSGESLNEIINQVLDFSKIEAGKISINPVTFEFTSLAADVLLLYSNNKNQGVKLLTDTDPKIPPYIKADRFRLTQIINNLVSNALKFTRNGSVEIHSRLESSHPKNKKIVIRIEVKDTGIGIPDSLHGQLFTPFSQVDNADTRKYEGTGLGLSICKQLVEIMGGTIGMNSEQGKGSNFWFTFPAMVAEEPISILKGNISGTSKRPIEILLAEDKVINQKVISLMITSIGHNIHIACNGKKALEMFKPGKYDLILMDIQMPVMDGLTATKKLKEKFDDLPPIVGLSANAFEGDREKYMALGMDEYLTKPVKKEDFERLIDKLLKS